jgi:superfamily I DNA/RNA helicase
LGDDPLKWKIDWFGSPTILLYRGYQDILKSQNAIDFDDLLLKVYGLFIDYPKIAAL